MKCPACSFAHPAGAPTCERCGAAIAELGLGVDAVEPAVSAQPAVTDESTAASLRGEVASSAPVAPTTPAPLDLHAPPAEVAAPTPLASNEQPAVVAPAPLEPNALPAEVAALAPLEATISAPLDPTILAPLAPTRPPTEGGAPAAVDPAISAPLDPTAHDDTVAAPSAVLPPEPILAPDPAQEAVAPDLAGPAPAEPLAAGAPHDPEGELLEEGDLVEVAPPTSPWIGRAAELGRLHALIRQATRGELAFIALTGPAGVGKTRLVEELACELEAASVRVYYASAGGPGASPFAAFERLLRARFELPEAMPPDQARTRLAEAVAALLPAANATEITHLVGRLFHLSFPDSAVLAPLAESPAQLDARTFVAVRRLIAADAATAPLLLVIDGVEEASPETVNLIHFLADGLGSAPLILLCVGRDTLFDRHRSFGESAAPLTRVELSPLDAAEAQALLKSLCPAPEVPPLLLEHVGAGLGGLPRAITEFWRYLRELGLVLEAPDGPKLDLARLPTALPTGLEQLVAARLHLLPAEERDLLEKAAVCGEVFWLDALVMLLRAAVFDPNGSGLASPALGEVAATGDRTRAEVEAQLRRLVERGLIVESPRSSIPGEREFRFAYPPWRQVIYDGRELEGRSRDHRFVAQWLELRPSGRGEEEQEAIGRHLERAGDGSGAVLRYRRAGDAARARYFHGRAARLYETALGCLSQEDLALRIHLWHDLGSVRQLGGQLEAALAAFEQMLRVSWVVASRTKAAAAFNKLGRVYRQKGELAMALDYFERALALFAEADDQRGVAGSLDDLGQVSWLLGRYDEALDRAAAALETRRRLGDRRAIALSLVNIGNIERHRGLFAAAEACYREALELRRGLGDLIGVTQCESQLGVLALVRGDVAGGRAAWERALARAERLGSPPLQAPLLFHLGEAALAAGQRKEARHRFERAEALARELDDKALLARTSRALGLVALREGDTAQAQTRIASSYELAEASGIAVDIGRAQLALGEVHAATLFDDTDQEAQLAEHHFARAVALFRQIGNEGELAWALERFGKYCVERGDMAAGKELLTEAHGLFQRLGVRSPLGGVIGEL